MLQTLRCNLPFLRVFEPRRMACIQGAIARNRRGAGDGPGQALGVSRGEGSWSDQSSAVFESRRVDLDPEAGRVVEHEFAVYGAGGVAKYWAPAFPHVG